MLTIVAISLVLPYSPLAERLGFRPMPGLLVGAIIALTVTYLGLVQAVKTWFYRRHELV